MLNICSVYCSVLVNFFLSRILLCNATHLVLIAWFETQGLRGITGRTGRPGSSGLHVILFYSRFSFLANYMSPFSTHLSINLNQQGDEGDSGIPGENGSPVSKVSPIVG